MESRPRRASVLGHAICLRGALRRRADHQRVQLHPWLRYREWKGALAPRWQLENYSPHTRLQPTSSSLSPAVAVPSSLSSSCDQVLGVTSPLRKAKPKTKPSFGVASVADPTCRLPLIYHGLLYVLGNNGIFDAYDLATGDEIYRTPDPHLGSGFSASPVAADGKIYLSNEDGDMIVVRAGREFDHIATNSMGELLMATPALSQGVMYVKASESPLRHRTGKVVNLDPTKETREARSTCRSVETITPSVFTATVYRQSAATLLRGIRTAKETRNKNGIYLHVIAKIRTS